MVVPPHAAERVPVTKSSAIRIGSTIGWSRWQCASTPPGVTIRPAASISFVAAPAGSRCAIATMRPPAMPRSQSKVSEAVAARALRTIRS